MLLTKVVLLLPERSSASWFWYLEDYKRLARYVPGSDLFREHLPDGKWKKLPPVREPWVVLTSLAMRN